MQRDQVTELHNISLVSNVRSILKNGILSHKLASQIDHESCAMPEIQTIRANKRIPNGRPLHEYANLYFHARNPMMYKIINGYNRSRSEIVIMRTNPEVLDLPETVISDGNAATGWTRFYPSPEGLQYLDNELIFLRDWRHDDEFEQKRRKSIKCSEVLVPDVVGLEFIAGIYVANEETRRIMESYVAELLPTIDVITNADLFFL